MKSFLNKKMSKSRRFAPALSAEQFRANLAMVAVILFWGVSYVSIKVTVMAIMLDALFFHNRLSFMKLLGVTIAVGGAYLAVTANGKVALNSAHFLGNILMICAMLSWSFFTLINKSL